MAPATTASTTSLMVTSKARATPLILSNERDVKAIWRRGVIGMSNGGWGALKGTVSGAPPLRRCSTSWRAIRIPAPNVCSTALAPKNGRRIMEVRTPAVWPGRRVVFLGPWAQAQVVREHRARGRRAMP